MAYIKWGPDLEIGHSTIDYQHRTLVNRLNDLYDIKQSGKGGEVLLQVVLDELVQYAQYHFATEEKLMAKYALPETEEHLAQHKAFAEKVGKFRSDYLHHKTEITEDLFVFLTQWLKNHILGTDKKMVVTLRELDPDLDPFVR